MNIRALILFAAAFAAVLLCSIVLLVHPADTVDLLAGAGIAAGAGLAVAIP